MTEFGEQWSFFLQQKDQENAANKYNQNFQGLYCTCHRPYPDLEDEVLIK